MTRLCELALKYDTDKNPKGHCYTPFYSTLFYGKSVYKVLEIGIGPEAPSLKMWEEYFPYADIFGIDEDSTKLINEGRIKSFFGDQNNKESIQSLTVILGNSFDLIVDDASHILEHQLMSAEVLLPLLAIGGFYVIEDVASTHSEKLFKGIRNIVPTHSIFQVETRDDGGDSRLLVIKKE